MELHAGGHAGTDRVVGTGRRIREEVEALRALPRSLIEDLARRTALIWAALRLAALPVGLPLAVSRPVSVAFVVLAVLLVVADQHATRERLLLADLGISRAAVAVVSLPVAAVMESVARALIGLMTGGGG